MPHATKTRHKHNNFLHKKGKIQQKVAISILETTTPKPLEEKLTEIIENHFSIKAIYPDEDYWVMVEQFNEKNTEEKGR